MLIWIVNGNKEVLHCSSLTVKPLHCDHCEGNRIKWWLYVDPCYMKYLSGAIPWPVGEGQRGLHNQVLAHCWCRLMYFATFKWKVARTTTSYHGTESISQAIFHALPLCTNTNAQGDKIKSCTTLNVTSGAGKYDQ